jgi:mono/diheme cytochrome c family protein
MMCQKSVVLVVFIGMMLVLAGCAQGGGLKYSDIPESGNALHGEDLFKNGVIGSPTCASCHSLDDSVTVGPSMGGIAERAATRVSGESAREYLFESIVTPSKYIVSGFTNVMYQNYVQHMSKQDIADLLAYLMTK